MVQELHCSKQWRKFMVQGNGGSSMAGVHDTRTARLEAMEEVYGIKQ
jgi:hypothetical protein